MQHAQFTCFTSPTVQMLTPEERAEIAVGIHDIVIAGGMESMSNVPYLIEKARFGGYRYCGGKMVSSLVEILALLALLLYLIEKARFGGYRKGCLPLS